MYYQRDGHGSKSGNSSAVWASRGRVILSVLRWGYFCLSEFIGFAGIPDNLETWGAWFKILAPILDHWGARVALIITGGIILTFPRWLPKLRVRRKGFEGQPSLHQESVTVIWDAGHTWRTNDLGKSCKEIIVWLEGRDVHVTFDDYGKTWVLSDDDSGYFLPKSIALFRGIKPNVPKRIRIEILGQNK